MTQKIATLRQGPLVPPQFTPDEWAQIALALHLSPQQANVVALVLQCHSDKEMAIDLGVSEDTINTHLRSIYARLGISGRVALVLRVFDTAKQLATSNITRTG